MIKNVPAKEIKLDKDLNQLFISLTLNNIQTTCNILKGDFYADSFNLFPITENEKVFDELFVKESNNAIKNFFTEKFYNNFKAKKNSFKTIKNAYVLGSSIADNYYSNLLIFLPRLFFYNEENLNLVIHRNLSNKFRHLINKICINRNIKGKLLFLDDDFYRFQNCKIPQFFNLSDSIKILRSSLLINSEEHALNIYIRREDSYYRKIINEADLISLFQKKDFKIINPQEYSIKEQIDLFSKAKNVVAPHGSSLANIVFCKPNTNIYEIGPIYNKKYELSLANRYKDIAGVNALNYFKIEAETVEPDKHSPEAIKQLPKKVIKESNYYKNLIVKLKKIEDLII